MSLNSDRDLEMWRTWNRTKSMMDLEALMHQMMPVIRNEVSRYSNVVSPMLLEAEAKVLAKKAFETYSPTAGTQLNTHLVNQLQKLKRMVYERQSTARVPEHLRLTYNRYRKAVVDLEDRHGAPPSLDHVADHLGLPHAKLQHLISTVEKRELLESGEGPSFQGHHDDNDKIELAYHDMTQLQRDIFDYRTGSHGKKELPNPEILTKLNLPQWQLSAELVKIRSILQKAQGQHG